MDTDAASFARTVIDWYRRYGRHDLPWQGQDAYRVWLSEIMLQQTQVNTVIPYYRNFVKRFPSIKQLADASIDEVLQHWQGLGYYARARNLHRAANIIRDRHKGRFPQTFEAVAALPGIGRSTAGAILSFAFGQRWPILDGNVKRVLARCFRVPGWYGQSETMKQLWYLAESVTPEKDAADFNQAMMDIGSMVCLKSKPKCEACPLRQLCSSYRHHSQAEYPQKKPSRARPHKTTLMLLHRCGEQVLLWRRPPSGIWGGLWSLPEVDDEPAIPLWQQSFLSTSQAPRNIQDNVIHHQFTHYSLDISLAIIELEDLPKKLSDADNYAWVEIADLVNHGLPTPVRKLLSSLQE
ncbi:MAG: A/G-specific adenine glycosylase [Gammaproteobacteria bacterium]|nr:MAG: adenine DNA glycosylase [Gammaproteobacteria bacterium]UCH39626.1 MAG: A/G-specific adenine glycosylase [Gammaproteobacteria bacterium]